ncbi:penicillin-binding protein activator LpoA [Marinobacter lipolyticus SM19]|uniref:Penicillin-binding protein activator LpoA n=1 Tax=Marinobacter lipolyticus SM19 TaxID=1318628 RepID=R8AYL7_9GAMM|nr:penicillin-binding protein activator [Marinobacter lipolyticus]EON91357.1 penicillin-binding protein activator LpoA [Marinobacter lipolyticus SM19]
MMPSFTRRHKRNYPEYREPAMTKHCLTLRTFTTVLMLTMLATGCASVNLETQPETAGQAIEAASKLSDRNEAQRYLLRSADGFQSQNDHESARNILQSKPMADPSGELKDQYLLLSMGSATALEDSDWARQLSGQLKPDQFLNYDRGLMAHAATLQAETLQLADDHLSAAATLILLAQSDTRQNAQQIHDRIWQALKATSDTQLSEESGQILGYEAQGWIELTGILREPGMNLDAQGRAVRQWQNNWPGHPAAITPPSELQLIASLAESRPEQITLALPLEGPLASAGKAIRDGFFAAYYDDQSADRSKTSIRVVNTAGQNFRDLYQELSGGDQDLIVGPLEKESLQSLAELSTMPVPVLGLNYLPQGSAAPSGLYQFGLSAEDEARQIADRLRQENNDQALALIPQGEWGDRLEAALLERMAENGSTALDIERYFREDNFRTIVAELLGITASRERAIDVERTAGVNVEFEPRRRQDADAVVMVAEPTIARQFKPLFAFYFGGDLPVYSPSMVYEGNPAPSRDRDLNDVTFTDIPWVLDDQNEFRDTATQALPDMRGQLGRLFAMGSDAWNLSKRLPLLRQVEGASIEGQTGVLTMAPGGSIHRQQMWARFTNGTAQLLTPESEEAQTEEQ